MVLDSPQCRCRSQVVTAAGHQRHDEALCSDPRGNQPAKNAYAEPVRDICKCGARRIDSQIGLEVTPKAYVKTIVDVFAEVHRVLRDDGVCWLNLGDSYANDGKWGGSTGGLHAAELHGNTGPGRRKKQTGLKSKDLAGIPWRVALALQDWGWYLRADVIWAKANPMPESVSDRPTKSHEYIFMLTKRAEYFYDALAVREASQERASGNLERKHRIDHGGPQGKSTNQGFAVPYVPDGTGRNRRSVWTFTTQPYPGAHFATFPADLPEICIKAGTSEHGSCTYCGAPFERVVERGDPLHEQRQACGADATDGYVHGGRGKHFAGTRAQAAYEVKARILAGMLEKKTIGWRPTCDCYDQQYRNEFAKARHPRKRHQQQAADRWFQRARRRPAPPTWDVQPCVVIDTFAGTATTGEVALHLGRSFIGIELNPKYANELARPRLEAASPLFAREVTPSSTSKEGAA